MRYVKHILNEIKLGFQDNLLSIWNVFRHPLNTGFSLLNSILHPFTACKNIYQFATASPIRFFTNLGLSVLEGKLISSAFEVPPIETAEVFLADPFNITAAEVVPYLPSSSTLPGLSLPSSLCTPTGCSVSLSTSSSPLIPTATSGVTQVTRRSVKLEK